MKKHLFSLLSTLVVLSSCIFTNQIESKDNSNKEFNSVYKLVSNLFLYPEKIKERETYDNDIYDLIADTDRFSAYYTPVEAEALIANYSTPEKVGIIGIVVAPIVENSDTLVVNRVYQGSPAEKAGVLKGDRILEVNGSSVVTVEFMNNWSVYVSGSVGTEIKLKVLRGEEVLHFKMIKIEMEIPTVWVDSIADGISLIQITQFSLVTSEADIANSETDNDTLGTWREFREALQETSKDEVTLLDLRYNPGGAINICTAMADELVAKNKILYLSDDRETIKIDTIIATKNGLGESRRFVMLANEGSASCSEIFIASVLGSRNISFVGKTTYGKGIGQGHFWTYASGLVKITSLGLSNNKSITWHEIGIKPSHEVEGALAQLEKATSLAQEMTLEPLPKIISSVSSRDLLGVQTQLSNRVSQGADNGGAYTLPTPREQ
jgi:carboxyl-terminal processing protease